MLRGSSAVAQLQSKLPIGSCAKPYNLPRFLQTVRAIRRPAQHLKGSTWTYAEWLGDGDGPLHRALSYAMTPLSIAELRGESVVDTARCH